MAQATQGAASPEALGELDEFDKRLQEEFRPRGERAENAVKTAVRTLAAQALEGADVQPGHVVNTIKAMIREIDAKLTSQINEIIHHEDFQKMESAWRGLHFLCQRTETGADLSIQVMSISKTEIRNELDKYPGSDWDQSSLFEKIYEKGYGVLGGDPVACIVGDYHFDHAGADVDVLRGMGKIAAAAHAPFIAGAGAGLFNADNWDEVTPKKDLASIFKEAPYMEWRGLRESEDSRYIGLACPRFLVRRAYGPNNPVDEFDFEEDTGGADASKFCWANSAYAMASNITRAYSLYGWCSKIRGVEDGGAVEELPTHTFKSPSGEWDSQCPTEISITDRRELEMASLGLMPLVYKQNSDMAAFIGAQSLHNPPRFEDDAEGRAATKNANLGARLPYIFACSRFAHYLKHMVRNKVGAYMEREEMQLWLSKWIMTYVTEDEDANALTKARRPLAGAEVVVEEDPENPGMYDAKFYLRPHYQLEGANISLRLVSKLPSENQ